MFSQCSEDVSQIVHMIGYFLTFYYHVIYVDFNILPQLRFKHFSHHPLISGSCILQAKGHHLVMVISNRSDKSRFLLIL